MAAGILLGPTVFGWFASSAYGWLFPSESLGSLNALSQTGLVIFVFLIGVRADLGELRRQGDLVAAVSSGSIVAPLLMGVALAQYLFPSYGSGDRIVFALFIGTAMSVTAFPVLARILTERNLLTTWTGSVAIACAAIDDVTAWIFLAAIVALAAHSEHVRPFWLTLTYTGIYLGVLAILGFVAGHWPKRSKDQPTSVNATLGSLLLAFASAAASEWIGIHSAVGAFVAGLVTPRRWRQQLIEQLEGPTFLLLLPLFFALTGIRTNLTLQAGAKAYFDLLLILLVAVVSKWGGTMFAARAKGMHWRDACQLGIMMNARGLVELIVLNVGLDSGVLSPALFSMMVCMAVVTTIMTTPLMDWLSAGKMKSQPQSVGA